jgi:uncharacterized membrane protein YphA (DoxX/SURF4 family)
MNTPADAPGRKTKPWTFWLGWAMTIIPSLLLLFSASMKLLNPPELAKNFENLGLPPRLATPLGILELSCTLLFLIPKTATMGAILLTGYMGGAILTHLRIGEPWFVQALLAVIFWLALFLREPRLRAILPLRN